MIDSHSALTECAMRDTLGLNCPAIWPLCGEDQARPCSIPMKCSYPRHYYGDLRLPLAHCSRHSVMDRESDVARRSWASHDVILSARIPAPFCLQVGWLPVYSRRRRSSGLRLLHHRSLLGSRLFRESGHPIPPLLRLHRFPTTAPTISCV